MSSHLFWGRLIYLFVSFLPALWLAFAFKTARNGDHLSKRFLAMLMVVPSITLAIVFSDRWMFLVWPSIEYQIVDGYVMSIRTHGPWFAVHAVYNFLISMAGIVIAMRSFALRHSYYRRRWLLILLGVGAPLSATLLFLIGPDFGIVMDYTPIGYAFGGFFIFLGIYRLDAFVIVPVARAQLVERMREAILVFDAELRIADANPAALRLLGNGAGLLGKGLRSEGRERAALPSAVERAAATGEKGVFDVAGLYGETYHYAVDAIELPGHPRLRGRLVVIRDETELRDALFRVEQLARKDALTALSNRRGFMEAAEAVFRSAERYGEEITAAMFDLDKFKEVNDSRGHAVGDVVLQAFARIMEGELRSADVAGRIGGEEFALVLPKTSLEGSRAVCERIRKNFAHHKFTDERGASFAVTVSVGIAELTDAHQTLASLMAAADMALYTAKANGRNRTEAAARRQLPLDL
jgi:diguanylate cyclase (GGDEF)-like protein